VLFDAGGYDLHFCTPSVRRRPAGVVISWTNGHPTGPRSGLGWARLSITQLNRGWRAAASGN